MAFWIYKCNSRQHPAQVAFGDWDNVFNDARATSWGSTEWVKDLSKAKPGDIVLAYQTNRNELVGIARVTELRASGRFHELILKPIEELRVKVRPLKKSLPAIERIPALQPGPIKTLYSISPADADALLRAAKAKYSIRDPSGKTEAKLKVIAGGFGTPEENRRVEQAAVTFVERHYKNAGWSVVDVSAYCCGYDLECRRQGSVLHVEVKGSRGLEKKFILTRNEAETWQQDSQYRLALVTNALVKPKLHEWSGPRSFAEFESTPIAFMCVPKPA
jgi:hypothetical protein